MIKIEEIEIISSGKTIQYYKNLGYDVKCRGKITIKIEDLILTSAIKIPCYCDYCSSYNEIKYYSYTKNVKINGKYRCNQCAKLIRREKIIDIFNDKEKCSEIIKKSKLNNIKKYGVENYSQTEEFKSAYKKTCLEKYGVENYAQTNDYKDKSRKTCLEKYGEKSYSQTDEYRAKYKKTCLEKYGVENPFQDELVKEKIKNKIFEKYGVENISKSVLIMDLKMSTNLKNWGVKNVFQSNEIKEKIKDHFMEKYGVDHPMHVPFIKKSIEITNLKKYGVKSYSQTEEFKSAYRKTCLERYGVDHPMQNVDIFNKAQNSSFRKHNYDENITYQGTYELDFINYCENNSIKIENGPSIDYTLDGKSRKYYSDFYIPSKNLICEVKSSWTFKSDYEENLAKQKYSIESGYNFLFIIDKNYFELGLL